MQAHVLQPDTTTEDWKGAKLKQLQCYTQIHGLLAYVCSYMLSKISLQPHPTVYDVCAGVGQAGSNTRCHHHHVYTL